MTRFVGPTSPKARRSRRRTSDLLQGRPPPGTNLKGSLASPRAKLGSSFPLEVKVDTRRAAVVDFKFGGVYSDLDSEWHGHFRDFIPRDIEIVSAGMQDGAISQWFMVFVPGYQIMAKAAAFAMRRILGVLCGGPEAKLEFKDKKYISGPPLLQSAFLGSLRLISADAVFSIKDRMHYYICAHFNDFASHNYDPVKDVSKKQSVPWESEDVSVIRTDVNRAAFAPEVCTEWGRIVGETFRRYTQLQRFTNVTSVSELVRPKQL